MADHILSRRSGHPFWTSRRTVIAGRAMVVREIAYDLPRRRPELELGARDARVLAELAHPRLAPWLEAVCDDAALRLTRPWQEGVSLGDSGAIDGDEDRLLALAADLLALAMYVHDRRRSLIRLHPGNVILRPDSRAVVTDWGVRLLRSATALVAPEVAAGCVPDPRSDLWELGATLHFAACGEMPEGSTVGGGARARGERLARLLESLLARSPLDRVASARHALEAISPTMAGRRAALEPHSVQPLGRDPELRALAAAVGALAGDRTGGVVFLRGGPGLGKTRLLDEAGRMAGVAGLEVISPNQADRSGLPFGTLAGCTERIATAMRAWSADEVTEVVQLDGRALLGVSSAFHAVATLRRQPRLGRLSPDAARHRMMRVACRAIGAFARRRPMVLLLDDLDRADPISLESLRYLVRTELHHPSDPAPILIVAAYQAVGGHGGRGSLRAIAGGLRIKGQAEELTLKPLCADDVRELVATCVEPRLMPEGFLARILDETGGNPFLIVETLRWVVREIGGTAGETNSWTARWERARRASGTPDDPLSMLLGSAGDVERMVSPVNARLRELSPEARGLLDVLALAGDDLPLGALRSLTGDDVVDEGLIECLRDGILVEIAPERFHFRHPLQLAAVDAQIAGGRETLHHRIGSAIEELVGQLDERAPLALAHHFHAAGDVERSLLYLPLAARLLKERHLPAAAMELFERFFVHLASLGPELQRRHSGRRLQVLQAKAETLHQLGHRDDALATWRRMAGVAEGHSERDLVTAWSGIARLCLLAGDAEEAGVFATRAVELAEMRGLELALADNLCLLAEVAAHDGEPSSALERLERALSAYRTSGESLGEARALQLRGDIRASHGEHASAAADYGTALDRFLQHGDRLAVAAVRTRIGEMQLALGDGDKALENYREALAIAREADHREGISRTLDLLGEAHRIRGELAEAREIYQQALQVKRELSDLEGSAATQLRIADVEIADRREDDARRILEQTLTLARRVGNRAAEAGALLRLAEFASQGTDATAARPLLDDALQAARACGDRATECRVLIARSAIASGDPAVAAAREAVLLGETLSDQGLLMRAYVRLGESLRAAGAEEEALRHYERALDEACRLLSTARTARASLLRKGDVLRSLQDAGEFVAARTDEDPAERYPVLRLAAAK